MGDEENVNDTRAGENGNGPEVKFAVSNMVCREYNCCGEDGRSLNGGKYIYKKKKHSTNRKIKIE